MLKPANSNGQTSLLLALKAQSVSWCEKARNEVKVEESPGDIMDVHHKLHMQAQRWEETSSPDRYVDVNLEEVISNISNNLWQAV